MVKKLLIAILACGVVSIGYLSRQVQATYDHNDDWVNGKCIASSCGTSNGQMTQTKTTPGYFTPKVCDQVCPKVNFSWTTSECPNYDSAYTSSNSSKFCSRKINGHWKYADKIVTTHNSVTYEKSNDPNKCHRPSDSTLSSTYGMDNDTRQSFKRDHAEWMNTVDGTNCTGGVWVPEKVETRQVSCNNAPIVKCECEGNECHHDEDVCRNLAGDQETTPSGMYNHEGYCDCRDGFHRVNNSNDVLSRHHDEQDNFVCEPNEVNPTPTSEPTVTPEPKNDEIRGFGANTKCGGEVEVKYTYKNGDQGIKDREVRFTYRNEVKVAKTDENGEAKVYYQFAGQEDAKAEVDGTRVQYALVKPAENCPAVGGAVLGTSTMAKTGVLSDVLMSIVGLSGAAMTMLGLKKING